MSTDDARVPLLTQSDLPGEYQSLFDTETLGALDLFRAMAHVPRAMQAYMRFGTALWNAGTLSTRERELAILTVARTLRSAYEWHQHVALGRAAGITDEELRALARGDDCECSEREQAIVRYADAVATGRVTDPLFEAVVAATDVETAVGVTMLAGHYVLTARVIDALAVPLDDDAFVGWSVTPSTDD
jgi:alkylhydroperoxidase family enzyme